MNIVSRDWHKADEDVFTPEATAQLKNLEQELDRFIQTNDIRVHRKFFNDITWDFFEAWLDDYYSDDSVACDDDAVKYLDDDYDDSWNTPYNNKQEAFDDHVDLWFDMVRRATHNMLNKRFAEMAKEYGLKYEPRPL